MRPEAYPHSVKEPIRLRETHISWVFLTGEFAYKMKKALKWSWIDYFTLAKRKAFCLREVELNKRLAPEVYLGTVPVVRKGVLFRVGATGKAVEWLVKMRELPEKALISTRFQRGWKISDFLVKRLARLIAGFYKTAASSKKISVFGGLPFVRTKVLENFSILEKAGWKLDDERKRVTAFMHDNKGLFAARVRNGFVRDCHGDLRSENIFVLGKGPRAKVYITDCIEFNDHLRFIDIVEDFAFLAMDFDFRGQRKASELLEREYLKASCDESAEKLLPFYKHYRALVRAKVALFKAIQKKGSKKRDLKEEAKKFIELAKQYVF